ncbi:carboxylesterase [Irpex rosettiformis]|uniref:Carboxylesterase n=1 Tax=Irpex rosettiformis TaxID=378272 RepID=A0ACB8TPW3_9APHY|nr:carboxylesterase [Irpex rosettiformis]
MTRSSHLQDELLATGTSVSVETLRYGRIKGGRAENGAAVFLEVPYALPPGRFQDPEPLPEDYRYEDKDYIYERSYAVQPKNDGQSAGSPFEDKVGLGEPTENPLFVNIVAPPAFPSKTGFPVKVYIHGGFLQFGSPHGLGGQAQFVAAEWSEVWVNIGYRLSIFGFLASDQPKVAGNFGFKDQWLALLWIKDNIAAFGGDPDDIQLSGLSAGAHSVHQILHHISLLPPGQTSPIRSAILQSNAIMISPKSPQDLRPQFQAIAHALGIDPTSPSALSQLRDSTITPATTLTRIIETDEAGLENGTFRGTVERSWLPPPTTTTTATTATPDIIAWQRSGSFAHALREKGVKSIIVGDLTEEWYLYAIAHPVKNMHDVELNLRRYYQDDFVKTTLGMYAALPDGVDEGEYKKLLGRVLSDGQVHLPVRLLARDLVEAGFPVLRYEIRWTPEQGRPFGYVTHGTDRALWAFRLPTLQEDQVGVARSWLDAIAREVEALEKAGKPLRTAREVLALRKDKSIGWEEDARWEHYMKLRCALPGEEPDVAGN